MASNWHYKTNLKEEHKGVEEVQTPEVKVSGDIQISEKNSTQRLKDWFEAINFKKAFKTVLKTFAITLPLVATVFLVSEAQKKQSLNSNAGANQAKLFFQASSITMPPETNIQMLVNTDGPVGFLRAEVTFDPTKMKLTKDVDVSGSPLKRVISVTPLSEINTTGRIIVVLAQDPTTTTAPSGDFQIGVLSLATNTPSTNISATINYDTAKSQIVNADATIFTITAINLNILLNPVATATPQSTPTPVVTSTPKPAVTSTPAVGSCRDCFRNKCNKVCESKDNKLKCPDCL